MEFAVPFGSPSRGKATALETSTVSEWRDCILDGTGPFTAKQYQRLYDKAESHLTVSKRLDSLDKSLEDSCKAHVKLDLLLKGICGQIATLQSGLTEEQAARDQLQGLVTRRLDHGAQAHVDRVKPLETEAAGLSARLAGLAKEFESFKASHNQLSVDTGKSSSVLEQRCTQLEKALDDIIKKTGHESQHIKDHIHSRVSDEQQTRDNLFDSLHDKLKREFDERDSAHDAAIQRMERVEAALSASVDNHGRELGNLRTAVDSVRHQTLQDMDARDNVHRSFQDQLGVANEARDRLKESLKDRVDRLEREFRDAAVKHAQESSTVSVTLEHLQTRSQEERGAQQGNNAAVKEQLASLQSETQLLQVSVKACADQSERKVAEVERKILGKLEVIKQGFAKQLADEKGARSEQHNIACQRLQQLDDIGVKQAQASESARTRLDQLQESLAGLGDKLVQEQGAREVAQEALGDRMAKERGAQEGSLSALRDRLAQLDETIGQEFAKRSRDFQLLSQSIQGQMSSHRDSREAAESAILEQLAVEKVARQKHHDEVQERFVSQRQAHEASQGASQQSVMGRIDAVQRSVGSCHDLIRKEIEGWATETKQLWKAIGTLKESYQNHMHDALERLSDRMRSLQTPSHGGQQPQAVVAGRDVAPTMLVGAAGSATLSAAEFVVGERVPAWRG